MRPASRSILNASERIKGHEDRLTEVLACVAQLNQSFAAALVSMAGLDPRAGERYEVGTQKGTVGGRRVDMQIAAFDDQTRKKLVWIEAKDGAAFQANQLQDYAKEIREELAGRTDGRVLAIIPPGESAPLDQLPGRPRWETRTWSDVAATANKLGRTWARQLSESDWLDIEAGQHDYMWKIELGRRHWLRAATAPDAPSQWRYLAELVEHLAGRLEQKGHSRMQPLAPEDVVAAQRQPSLSEALRDLRRGARQFIRDAEPAKSGPLGHGWYQNFEPIEPKWFSDPARFGAAHPQLFYYPVEDWTPERLGAPAFGAGLVFEEPPREARHSLNDETWQSTLPDNLVMVERVAANDSRKVRRVVRTKYLSELIVEGSTLDEQAEALGDWANEAIAGLMNNVSAPAPSHEVLDNED